MTPLPSPGHQRRRQVALFVETSLASGRDILRGLARYVREHEPWSLYHEPRSLEDSPPRWLRRWQGHGIIARLQNKAMVEAVRQAGVPVVDVLGVVPNQFPLVHVDDAAIARMAAEHLLERGFRHFGFLGIAGENWSLRRRDTFVESVRHAGCSASVYDLPRHAADSSSWETVEDDLAAWVKHLPKPAGVMVCSDQRGPQILEACRRAAVGVPDEVAVLGVDDDEPLCEVANPPLSSVRAGHLRVGYEAAALLDRLMRGHSPPREPLLIPPVGITTRASTDVLAIADRHISEALRLIREHACEGLDVSGLARRVGLSRSVLQRRFRAVLGRSPHEEILRARLKRAMELLLQTELPLADIAERAGFNHQEYMGAVFKARLGTTPGQFRRQGAARSL